MGVIEILCSFRLALQGKTNKEILETRDNEMHLSSRLDFLEKFLENNIALSDIEDNTSRPLNRKGIADLLLLRTLLPILQKSRESSVWEVMDAFVLVTYVSLSASRTLLQQKPLFCWYKQKKKKKNDFYKLWQRHMKIMEKSEV